MEITLIIGLPGSGKTQYANSLGMKVYDDINSVGHLPETLTENIVIVDQHFCNEDILRRAEKLFTQMWPDVIIKKIYFENDPVRCAANVGARMDGRTISPWYIEHLSENYNPPENSLSVWRG